jgi:hypothetical protein
MAIALRQTRIIPHHQFVAALLASTFLSGDEGASFLLDGEASGFSIDATSYDTITPEVYEGGPVGGTVSVGTSGVFASDNVALDSSILTQAGTSPKMVHFDSAPYVRWSPHNLSLYSQQLDDAGFITDSATVTGNTDVAPDGTTTAGTLTADSTGFDRNLRSTFITSVSGFEYTASCYVKAGTETWYQLAIYDNVGFDDAVSCYFELTGAGTKGTHSSVGPSSWPTTAATITSVGNGWYRCAITTTVNVTAIEARITIAEADNDVGVTAGDTIKVWGLQLNRGPIATPYIATTSAARIGIPQAYDAYEDCFGVLVEPAATNLCLRSEDLTTTWINSNSSESTNAATAPDGSSTADKLVEDSANDIHRIYQTVTAVDNTIYTMSVYAKAAERTWFAFNYNDASIGNKYTWFNLGTGTIGTSQNDSASITAVGNGWYRCTVTRQTSDPTTLIQLFLTTADGIVTYAGDGSSGMYFWGAQIELGSVATSYIPTLGSTATRAVDDISAPVSSFPYVDGGDGAIIVMGKAYDDTGANCNIWSLDDGSNTDRIGFYRTTGTHFISDFIASGGVTQSNYNGDATNDDTLFLAGMTWETDDIAIVVDGGAADTDTDPATIPTSITTLHLGMQHSTQFPLLGMIYQLTYLPRKLAY